MAISLLSFIKAIMPTKNTRPAYASCFDRRPKYGCGNRPLFVTCEGKGPKGGQIMILATAKIWSLSHDRGFAALCRADQTGAPVHAIAHGFFHGGLDQIEAQVSSGADLQPPQ